MYKKYIAEGVGTFALSFSVLAGVAFAGTLPVAVPVLAALTLGLFVYTIGAISGCHINPAVTLGLLSIKKITLKDAGLYIAAQLLGAVLALLLAQVFALTHPADTVTFDVKTFLAEMLGASFFTFGIASVVYGKVHESVSGLVIGGSLLLGVLVSSLSGALGILNPAVALALSSLSIVYIFAPIIGAVLGFWAYRFVSGGK